MADDSEEIQQDEVPFHPCLTPRGMPWYDFNVLTPLQQKLLNGYKIDVVRENNRYLARHPEIRAIVALFLRAILKEQSKLKTVADFAKDYFSRSRVVLQQEIADYMKERGEPLKKEGDSAVNIEAGISAEESSEDDYASMYQQGYYTYLSYTDEPSCPEEVEELSIEPSDIDRFYQPSFVGQSSYYSSSTRTRMTVSEYERRKFELLFASRASICTGESIEASTIDMTKQYMLNYFGDADMSMPGVNLDEGSKQAVKEITVADEIQDILCSILDNMEDGKDQEGYYEDYIEQLDKRELIEMDLENMSVEGENFEDTGPRPSKKTSLILDTMLEYEEWGG